MVVEVPLVTPGAPLKSVHAGACIPNADWEVNEKAGMDCDWARKL